MKKTLAFAIFASLSLLASQGMAAEGKAPAEDKPAAEHEHKSCCPVMKDKMKKMHEGHDMQGMDHAKMHEGHDMKAMEHGTKHEGHSHSSEGKAK